MKKYMLLIPFLIVASTVFAQQEKSVESKISLVTVFLNKAEVTREIKTRIQEGTTNLIISGLTAQLDPNSVQVSGKGKFVLMGISHQLNFLNDVAMPARLKILNDSIHDIQAKIHFENAQKQILDKEEQMLLSNQKIGGTDQNLPVNELKNMADFFRNRLSEIAMARLRHDERIKKLNERLSKVQHQVRTLNELSGRNTSEVVVNITAKESTEAEIVISYVVGNAGWVPLYDVRAVDTKASLSLLYKANIFQSTGENWKNVKLKLSTANPTLGGVKPDLPIWHLDFHQPREYVQKYKHIPGRQGADAAPQALSREQVVQQSTSTADFVNVTQTSLNAEFNIALPYTINSASKPTTVDISRHELPAGFRYAAAPKLDPDAFLMAGTTGWADLNLLPGEANVFFEGSFVGKSFIDPGSVHDTLFFSLGRNKRIVVKRDKVKDFNSRVLIGSNQKESHAFEIKVRNNQSQTVAIAIEDQIPLSKNSQIEVTLVDTGGAQYSSVSGKLVWEITLKPNESKRLLYHFEVKFPKDKIIAGLN
jgi:uncharacterized protein (TIGR02231 family)